MSNGVLDKILTYPSIPSPPGVAMQLLELTRDPNVSVSQIGKVVQNDPALSAKVLKTINSSLFGLPQQVTKIDRALALLGLNAVKSLVLGFSLVDCTRGIKGKGLDLQAYWRRGIYSAAGARNIAVMTSACDPDEAFTAAIFQDLGVLAAAMALGDQYAAVLSEASGDHQSLAGHEDRLLGISHPAIGAALAERWKLPQQYVEAIRWHHEPERATGATGPMTRMVYLGGVTAEVLSSPTPAPMMARLMNRLSSWFPGRISDLEDLLNKVTSGAKDLAKVFEKDVGAAPDIQAILAQAGEQQVETQIAAQREAAQLQKKNQELAEAAVTDGLTKVRNRKGFDADLARLFDECASSGKPLGVLFVDGDKFKSVNDRFGHPAGDAVLVEIAARLKKAIGQEGVVCRYGGEEFAVLLPGLDSAATKAAGERARAAIENPHFDLSGVPGAPKTLAVTISVGAMSADPKAMPAPAIIKAADEAVYQSKQNGRNRVTLSPLAPSAAPSTAGASAPASTPAGTPSGGPIRVLLVDDDALAGKLLQLALQKRQGIEIVWAMSAADANRHLAAPRGFGLIICDVTLGDGNGLDIVRQVRQAEKSGKPIPILVMSADDAVSAEALKRGATAFASKRDLCTNLNKWLDKMLGEWMTKAA